MGKHDEWCELCDQKLKSANVIINGKKLDVCNHCKSICPEDESEQDSN